MNNGLISAGFIGAALLGLTSANAHAQMENFYVRGGIGPMITDDADLKEFAAEPVDGAELDFDTGFNFEAVFGYQATPWFAVEAELGIAFNTADGSGISCPNGDLAIGRYPIMINVVFQYPNSTKVIPFVGAGIGGAGSVLYADDFRVGSTVADGTFSDFVFAYHFFGGLRYDFAPQMGVGLYYNYLTTEASEWEPDSSIGTSGDIRVGALHSHSINVAFTFRF